MKTARQIFLDALRFYGRNWTGLVMTAGLLLLPANLVVAMAARLGGWAGVPARLQEGALGSVGGAVAEIFLQIVAILSCNAVTLYVARDCVGQPLDWRHSWRMGLQRARPALTATLAMMVPMIGFMILFMLPGLLVRWLTGGAGASWAGDAAFRLLVNAGVVFIAARTAYVATVAAVERKGGFHAYGLNLDLLRGRFFVTLAVLAPIEIAHLALTAGFAALPLGHAVAVVGQAVSTWLLLPLETTAAVLLYLWARGQSPSFRADELATELQVDAAAPR